MNGLNLPSFSTDWFAPAVIVIMSAIISGIVTKVAGGEIPRNRAISFLVGTLLVTTIVILFWYNVIGIIIFNYADSVASSQGCRSAYSFYKSAVDWNPKYTRARIAFVECSLELNRAEDAVEILESLEPKLLGSWNYWNEMAWAYYGIQSYEKMISSVERAADLYPENTGWIDSLGEKLHRELKYREAEAILRIARTRNGSDGAAVFWLAWSLYEQDKYDDALSHFDECIRLNSSGYFLARCIAGKGFTLRDTGRYQEARSLFETSLQIHSDQEDVRISLEQLPR